MENSNNIQVLTEALTEVDASQTRLNLVSLCIKAQQDLAKKLGKECERREENRNFKQNNNLQLEFEIKNAEQEIKRCQTNYESIRSANTELKKELLLAKKSNFGLYERMQKGEKKYENLWLECKSRYESLPYVQKLMQVTKKEEALKEELVVLHKEIEKLTAKIKKKHNSLIELERKQIVKLADFVINEMPGNWKIIKVKLDERNKLNAEIEIIMKENSIETAMVVDENWPNLSKNTDDTLMMPRLELASAGIDVLSVKLELNKKKTLESKTQIKRPDYMTDFDRNLSKRFKVDEIIKKEDYISPYFKNSSINTTSIDDTEDNKTNSYSKKKLINILENIRLNETETQSIVSKINTDDLQEVKVISSDAHKITKVLQESPENKAHNVDNEDIEVIDLTQSNNIILPPTQFFDMTQERVMRSSQDMQVTIQVSLDEPTNSEKNLSQPKSSQEIKKKVSFEMPMTIQEIANDSADVSVGPSESPNQTMTIQMEDDIASETDYNYMKIKDMILKKHNVDVSPQFIYAKNSILRKDNETENIVTSKFFEQPRHAAVTTKLDELILKAKDVEVKKNTKPEAETLDKVHVNTMEVDDLVTSPPSKEIEKPMIGFLFNHDPQGFPESLDISMSTTGFESDPEYTACVDSSLLLSPKGEEQASTSAERNNGIGSQEKCFFSGFRKSGLSFFGQKPASDNDDEDVEQNQESNFKFNFGGQEKKSRGGLFSFFR